MIKAPNIITAKKLRDHVEQYGTQSWLLERCPRCGVGRWVTFKKDDHHDTYVSYDPACACTGAMPHVWVWGWERLANLLEGMSPQDRDRAWGELTRGSD